MMSSARTKICFLFFALLFLPVSLHAQSLGLPDVMDVQTFPDIAGPHTPVLLQIQGASIDPNNATISWLRDGALADKGVGLKEFRFTTGALAETTTITVVIEADGRTATKDFVFRPQSVDLLFEGDGYTPPFYRGKSPIAPGSSVLFVAIPHLQAAKNSTPIPSSQVVYKWIKNGTVLGSLSGVGKNSLRVTAPNTGSLTIRVEASSLDGTLEARGEQVISVTNPSILFYEDDPSLGVRFDRALPDSFSLTKEESRIVAVPFAFSASKRESSQLSYAWKVGGEPLTLGNEKSVIVIGGGSGGGAVSISLSIDSVNAFMQGAIRSLSAISRESAGANPFTQQ